MSNCIGALFLAHFVRNILDHFIFANCCTISLFCKKLYQSTNFLPNCCTTGDHNLLMFRFFVFFALASAHYQPIIGSNVLNRLHRAFRLSIDEVDYEIKGLSKGPLPLSPIYNCPDVYLAVCYCYFVIVTWPL